jgi:hypothetical protein
MEPMNTKFRLSRIFEGSTPGPPEPGKMVSPLMLGRKRYAEA